MSDLIKAHLNVMTSLTCRNITPFFQHILGYIFKHKRNHKAGEILILVAASIDAISFCLPQLVKHHVSTKTKKVTCRLT